MLVHRTVSPSNRLALCHRCLFTPLGEQLKGNMRQSFLSKDTTKPPCSAPSTLRPSVPPPLRPTRKPQHHRASMEYHEKAPVNYCWDKLLANSLKSTDFTRKIDHTIVAESKYIQQRSIIVKRRTTNEKRSLLQAKRHCQRNRVSRYKTSKAFIWSKKRRTRHREANRMY